MRKLLVALAAVMLVMGVQAQTDTTAKKNGKKDWSKVTLSGRANDHFMIQAGYDGWGSAPDTIRTKGFGRHLNFYFMLDKPFKSDPRFSIAGGLGIGSSNIYFDKQEAQIAGHTPVIVFSDVKDTTHFKKFKLTEAWAEIPVEFRFVSNPLNTNNSFKFALGMKLGTMLSAHTKGKDQVSKSGAAVNSFIMKESTKRYFNTTRFAATMRVGYGPFTLYGAYQLNPLFKDNAGPAVHPFSIGLTLSGL
ncbi:outer membrane beta-barrel protein [Flavihumibacter profundi]|uniref:outer membrane beta-barrel protein n=1 Tax=Flavihumibacter profundi TaxID=2716883 RepID=UPI001CC52584|nr:outer membrane beta-barrel protein [Flavihumibacter profundi]MBZ5857779.1 outer membrane beta-barrel protein [Flavihumibacter profundi]